MFDIGFLELLICGVIALLVLGPERLPSAARTAGRWVGNARRLMNQFSTELDRQIKAEELREQLRKAGDIGLDDVEKTVKDALNEAKKYEHLIVSNDQESGSRATASAPPQKPEVSPAIAAAAPNPAPDAPTPSSPAQDSTPEPRS